jgi:hypothetical protein
MSDEINIKYIQDHSDISLAQISGADLPQTRSESNSASIEELLHTGALPGSVQHKQSILNKNRAKRIAAYMGLDKQTVQNTKGWRTRTCYRLVTYMARILGELNGPMMLSNLLHDQYRPDPSNNPFEPNTSTKTYGTQAVVDILQNTNFTYLPPHTDHIDVDFDAWLSAYSILGDMLRITDGSEQEPESGVLGSIGLFDEASARFVWPTRDDLLQYEEEMLLTLFEFLTMGTPEEGEGNTLGSSVQAVESWVRQYLGYGRSEAVLLVQTALLYGEGAYGTSVEGGKVRELKMLEAIADVSKIGSDPRAMIAARKQIQLVKGLTKNDTEDSMDTFRDLASKALETEEDKILLGE